MALVSSDQMMEGCPESTDAVVDSMFVENICFTSVVVITCYIVIPEINSHISNIEGHPSGGNDSFYPVVVVVLCLTPTLMLVVVRSTHLGISSQLHRHPNFNV